MTLPQRKAPPADAEALFRQALEQVNDGVAIFDADDRLIFCNDGWLNAVPHIRDLGGWIGRSFEELVRHGASRGNSYDPDMQRDPERWITERLERHRAATGKPHMRPLADGRWLQTTEYPTANGGVMTVMTDMTPAKQAQTRLRDAVESLDAVFTLWDDQARLIMWNRRFSETWPELADLLVPGVPERALIERNIERGVVVIPPGEREAYFQRRRDSHQTPASEIEIERSDGRVFVLRSYRTSDGGQVRLETEITETKRQERELRQATEIAEAANRSKSAFLANVSHELRTPLNAVIGFSDLLRSELFGPLGSRRYVEYADDINSSGRHLLELISDLLDFSRIEAGRYKLSLEPTDLRNLIEDAARLVSPAAEEGQIKLTTQVAADLGRVPLDRRAVLQVLLNLLSNGIKFTPPGGSVTVNARVVEGDVQVSVADTGIGIAESDLPRLARPFEQVDNALTRTKAGTGLGLAITKALLEQHGGRLKIVSQLREGTTVTAYFPYSAAP